ncbi:MAG: hypothetical protein M3081_12900 [Gemmatimonadota bacterium]|nr:hypothetical protein [Gemmatimonadota bacterium]
MVDKPQSDESNKAVPDAPAVITPPKRPPGHRSTDVRDTVAEMAARAQEISQEAGSKVSQAMKDVISAAAGLAGFAVESARDLVQYMVRRGQMTQEEADRLLREAEEAASKRKPVITEAARGEAARAAKLAAVEKESSKSKPKPAPAVKKPAPPTKAKSAPKPAASKKPAAKASAKPKPKPKPAAKAKAASGKRR